MRCRSRSSQPLALSPGALQARQDTLSDATLFELGQGSQNVELEASSRRTQVDPFPERHEPHPEGLELVQQPHEVFQAAPQAVQPADDDGVQCPAPGIGDQPVQRRPPVRGA